MAKKKTAPTTPNDCIEVHGARVNNLKNISVTIPRDQLIVISGLSGSGKSSLAFDTLYAEGQRRYVESLSVYARQFVEKLAKPECDYITGLPPAIAIQQRVVSRTPRSTVGTTTEIYDYLRMLFARIGRTFSPISGTEVKRHSVSDVAQFIATLPQGTRYLVAAPLLIPQGRSALEHLQILQQQGYNRIRIGNEDKRIADITEEETLNWPQESLLVVDRLTRDNNPDAQYSRLADSVSTAFFEGKGEMRIVYNTPSKEWKQESFSEKFEADGITFEEPSDNLFSFNSPIGACPTCEGFSKVTGIDEDLVIANKRLSVYDNAVMCWRGVKMSKWKEHFIRKSAPYNFPIHRPYNELTEEQKELLWNGNEEVEGINQFFNYLASKTHKMHYRIMLARYRGRTTCPTCKGRRLRKEALYVKVHGKNIAELVEMPIAELRVWLNELQLTPQENIVGERLLTELRTRVGLLHDIGLGYLTCNRISATLSGGESQRINLATSLGGGLIGALYILDEPSIGLHSRDTHLLINIMRKLTSIGNSVVVVEHDEEIIRAANQIIDIGPDSGQNGGEVVYQGSPTKLPSAKEATNSHTVKYLLGLEKIPWRNEVRKWDRSILIQKPYKHNLKGETVQIPLHTLTLITGVSGSGKSSLVREVLYEGIRRLLDDAPIESIACEGITGNTTDIKAVEYIDQNSIGKNTRSNPVTYIGAYDDIRKIFAEQPLAKQMGYTPVYFSFNKEGGRCEYCKGDGFVTVEMQFMADMEITCEECHGKRFSDDVLEVTFGEKNIYEILKLTVDDAIAFFQAHNNESGLCAKVAENLQALQEVGLGYLQLGQSSSTLSGGESQRVKLASYLVKKHVEHTLFIFDEPTTGLHLHDIKTLLQAFNALINKGHSVVIVEHNLDVIKQADWVIDLGPEAGHQGGHVVYQGTPQGLMHTPKSYTGKYLHELYKRQCK